VTFRDDLVTGNDHGISSLKGGDIALKRDIYEVACVLELVYHFDV